MVMAQMLFTCNYCIDCSHVSGRMGTSISLYGTPENHLIQLWNETVCLVNRSEAKHNTIYTVQVTASSRPVLIGGFQNSKSHGSAVAAQQNLDNIILIPYEYVDYIQGRDNHLSARTIWYQCRTTIDALFGLLCSRTDQLIKKPKSLPEHLVIPRMVTERISSNIYTCNYFLSACYQYKFTELTISLYGTWEDHLVQLWNNLIAETDRARSELMAASIEVMVMPISEPVLVTDDVNLKKYNYAARPLDDIIAMSHEYKRIQCKNNEVTIWNKCVTTIDRLFGPLGLTDPKKKPE